MKRMLLSALAAAFTLTAAADDWQPVVRSTTGFSWAVRESSLELATNNRDKAIVRGLFQVRTPSASYAYEHNYVTVEDCAEGSGMLVTVSAADRSRARYTNEFALGGASVSSKIAEYLCVAALALMTRELAKPSGTGT